MESEISKECVLQKPRSDSSIKDNIPLAKLASNNWSDTQCQHNFIYKFKEYRDARRSQKETRSEEQETGAPHRQYTQQIYRQERL